MVVFSRYKTIDTSCMQYMHPYDPSCSRSAYFLMIDAVMESFRIYVMAYSFALLMRRKIPSKEDIKKTLLGILQSTVFLTTNGVMYSLSMCTLRFLFGGFSVLTASFVPSYIASLIAILVERPSRRNLLCLYVTNVASETLFRMATQRNLVRPIKYGEILIFSASIAQLLYFFKGESFCRDPIFGFLRFLVGRCEEGCYNKTDEVVGSNRLQPLSYSGDSLFLRAYASVYNRVHTILDSIKRLPSHSLCKHSCSCLYYVVGDGPRMFLLGYLFQFCLKVFLQLRRIIRKPVTLKNIIFSFGTMRLGALFALFNIIFRGVACSGRWILNKDDPRIALPAGLIAGLSFAFFRDNTIALYFMWKSLHMLWKKLEVQGYVREIPMFSELLYSFSTAILFHAALLEPTCLRPSYWRFLMALSGKRVKYMDRICLDTFGYDTSNQLAKVLAQPNNN